MSRARLLTAAVALLFAGVFSSVALDVRGWDAALRDGHDRRALLAGDPVGRMLDAPGALRRRSALDAYRVAERAPQGFDNGERRARARSTADALLAGVAATGPDDAAGQAQNLLGLLAVSGRAAGGELPQERARAAWEAAIRVDPSRAEPKYNLELLLRREAPTATREGAENGTGPRGRSRRGAGAGSPGRGY